MKRLLWRWAAILPLASVLLIPATAAADSHAIDPEADKILQSMSSYLGGLSTFSVRTSIENEIITDAKLHFARKGPLADVETISDGKRFTMHSKIPNLYIQREAPGTIDDIIRLVEFETGLPVVGADLMFADAYAVLRPGILQASYLGTVVIDGTESHHLAFRGDQADWQLWVKTGAQALPTRYVITSKWLMGAPQFALRFHDWKTVEKFGTSEFMFTAASDARQVDILPLEMGDGEAEDQQ
jgi:hypothetical protein